MINDKKILITGSNGQLAKEFKEYFKANSVNYRAVSEKELDITDLNQMKNIIGDYQPNVILNCAAYNLVDQAEENEKAAYDVNSLAVSYLARLCKDMNILLVHYSTDYVFDGKKNGPFTESDLPNPLNVYGKSKFEGEKQVKKYCDDYLIFRLSWVFGDGTMNFMRKLSEWSKKTDTLKIVSDEISVPTYTEDIVDVTIRSMEQNIRGLYHLTNNGYCSRYEWAKYYFGKKGENIQVVQASGSDFPSAIQRPMYSVMSNDAISKKLNLRIPSWQDAVDRYLSKYCVKC